MSAQAFHLPHPGNPDHAPENRVWGFSATPDYPAGEWELQPVQPHRENRLAATIIASGRLYITKFDAFGLSEEDLKDAVGEGMKAQAVLEATEDNVDRTEKEYNKANDEYEQAKESNSDRTDLLEALMNNKKDAFESAKDRRDEAATTFNEAKKHYENVLKETVLERTGLSPDKYQISFAKEGDYSRFIIGFKKGIPGFGNGRQYYDVFGNNRTEYVIGTPPAIGGIKSLGGAKSLIGKGFPTRLNRGGIP